MDDLSDWAASTGTGTCTVNVPYVIELEWARSTKLDQRQPSRDVTIAITNSSMITASYPSRLLYVARWLATDYSIQRSHEASSGHTSQISVSSNFEQWADARRAPLTVTQGLDEKTDLGFPGQSSTSTR
jgi:hypothetical protein